MTSGPNEAARQQYNDEYGEVSENLRHYSNLRFAIFTVLLAAQAGLISIGFDLIKQTQRWAIIVIKIGGLVATFVFWIFHERVIAYRKIFMQRAICLEEKPRIRSIPIPSQTNA